MSMVENLLRDSQYLGIGARVAWNLRKVRPAGTFTVANLVEQWAKRTPGAIAIRFEGRSVTYSQLDKLANRYANWALSRDVQQGDVVALLMENRPEYVACWLGLAKIGAVGALINTNLSGASLAHCLRVCEASLLVLGDEMRGAWLSARDQLEQQPDVWVARNGDAEPEALEPEWHDLDSDLVDSPDFAPTHLRDGLTARDKLFYIYTSGTTGNPKAANISHFRFLSVASSFAGITKMTSSDRMYVVLPLYHTAGGTCALGMCFTSGATMVLRRKFSASQFWKDCREEGVTVFQYIGELCRYLVNAPEQAGEQDHQVRLCVGNGLRPDIWQEFQERFAIPKIVEFYGATEGNVALFNAEGRIGAVGRIPPLLRRMMQIRLVRFDHDREEPMRGDDGFCIECEPGEPGEAIGLIPSDPNAALGQFEGYTDKRATEKKILGNVFRTGDAWFRTGDLLRHDEEGYFYFVDRIGDTFRWKGENVSTNEVSEVLGRQPGVREANVYGVEVPGTDGRAGMASLVVDDDFDLDRLHGALRKELAAYARPIFVRLQREMEITGTFKHRKVDLVEQGFDPSAIQDQLYFDDPEKNAFVNLDSLVHERIASGRVRI